MFIEQINKTADLLLQAQYAIAFTGAGISTPSGVPDFRSPNSGIWKNVDPLAVASMYGFRQNPAAFYNWIYPLAELTLHARPNPAHEMLAHLEHQHILKAIITQNIDTLHTRAGSQNVYELHGHLREATCSHCFTVFPAEPIILKFLEDKRVPHCPHCGGVIKPNVILFGEQLPIKQFIASQDAARKADVMFIIGSSLEVAPAADLPLLSLRNGGKLIILNYTPTHLDDKADIVIHADAAQILPQIVQRMEAVV
ncbi:MAG: NAD-dependent deacylase [Anaerolineae bacterium]|nr:NAD-dependent deacylase [Anaerolineae bacterium]